MTVYTLRQYPGVEIRQWIDDDELYVRISTPVLLQFYYSLVKEVAEVFEKWVECFHSDKLFTWRMELTLKDPQVICYKFSKR